MLLNLDARTLTLYETAHIDPLNKTYLIYACLYS